MKKLVFLLCWTTGLMAQTGEIRNPRTSPEDVAAGALIFRSHCAECHGLHGEGGRGANLAGGTFYHGSTDADLLRNISEGIPGTEMPGTFFSDNQVWQMVSFVRSLSERAIETRVAGDPAAGEPLFRGKGGCARCHKVDGNGGRLGPDLSNVGSSRSLKHLRQALEKPDSEVLPAFWRVSVTNRSGKSYSGFRLNEDTYSIQVLDMEERLHSFSKKDLQSLKIEKTSVMPSYASVFSDRELDNLLAYLSSLRRKARTQ